jgi:hypothetical protein
MSANQSKRSHQSEHPYTLSSSSRETTHIAEVHDPKLAETAHDFAAYLVGDVQLRQGHVRRAEQRVLVWRHAEGKRQADAVYEVTFVVGKLCSRGGER